MPLPAHKTGCLMRRIRNKDWWDDVLLHFTVVEWKEFYNDRTCTYTTFSSKGWTARSTRQTSLRYFCVMRCPFSFGFQSDREFTCTLNQISKGINHPLQTNWNFIPIEPSIRLKTDYLVACKRSQYVFRGRRYEQEKLLIIFRCAKIL